MIMNSRRRLTNVNSVSIFAFLMKLETARSLAAVYQCIRNGNILHTLIKFDNRNSGRLLLG